MPETYLGIVFIRCIRLPFTFRIHGQVSIDAIADSRMASISHAVISGTFLKHLVRMDLRLSAASEGTRAHHYDEQIFSWIANGLRQEGANGEHAENGSASRSSATWAWYAHSNASALLLNSLRILPTAHATLRSSRLERISTKAWAM